ncbi:MAG: hypothetical protein EOM59_21170, partial [Clostridia bacterium]|nr:hypothetical protein [Clostridia bacterium]
MTEVFRDIGPIYIKRTQVTSLDIFRKKVERFIEQLEGEMENITKSLRVVVFILLFCPMLLWVNFAMCATNTQTYSNTSVKNIPDNSTAGATSTLPINDLNVPDSAIITNMAYGTLIYHTYPRDLKVTLSSPSGKTLTIWNNEAGTNIDLAQTTSYFNGEHIKGGNWSVKAVDSASADIGTIQRISLAFTYESPPGFTSGVSLALITGGLSQRWNAATGTVTRYELYRSTS